MKSTSPSATALDFHVRVDPHRQSSKLSEVILGGQDGLVNRLAPVEAGSALRSAIRVGLAALMGSAIPLVPFMFAPLRVATWFAIGCAALVLFSVGAYKAVVTVGRWWWSGLEMAAIGIASALVGYGIGALFAVS